MPQRSAAEIRSSIESNRQELALSVANLRGEVERATDWRSQVDRHRNEIAIGAAALGLLLGTKLLKGRRRRRRA